MGDLENVLIETMAELIEHRSAASEGHVGRVRVFVKALLHAIKDAGVYEDEIANIDIDLAACASQLHDVGKIAVKDGILLKPAALTDAEFELVKNHTALGGKIIGGMITKAGDCKLLQYAKVIAETHHERWDGGGYHQGLKGAEIPLLGRVMAIADVYDALVTKRPYKEAFTHDKAVEIIKNDGGVHFDPVLVQIFVDIICRGNRYPNHNMDKTPQP
ncbi:MAG: HD domain-containing protein [Defluviitaleaceae bacterium]|nr:HD domain-containing protein [Defluviitaleaceae bacterium]